MGTAAWKQQEEEAREGRESKKKKEAQKRLCITYKVQRERKDWTVKEGEEKEREGGEDDMSGEAGDNSNMRKTGRTVLNIKGERGAEDGSREISYFYLIGQANFKQFSGTICEKEYPPFKKHSSDITPLVWFVSASFCKRVMQGGHSANPP